MPKERSLTREYNAHLKKFPFPDVKHFELEYKDILVSLRGGHLSLYYELSERLQPTPWGWETAPISLQEIGEDYSTYESMRTALKRMHKKFKSFKKAGLTMTLKGNGKSAFSLRLEY